MEKIKNIFDYATKELSQDAFLIWLFENWNCELEDVRLTSQTLLRTFLGFDEKQEFNIKEITTKAQYKKIDIIVKCIINNEKYVIAIEDKTTSDEHNQLLQYRDIVERDYLDFKHFFVYYKTSLISEEENNRINHARWEKYDISRIYRVFSKINHPVKNCLLLDYIKKIKILHSDLTGILPDDIREWNINHWYNFILNHDWKLNDIDITIGNYQNLYLWIAFNLKERGGLIPYLEIRSRDFEDGFFTIRILMYGISEEIIKENESTWKINISKSNLFKVHNYSKQIGSNKNQNSASNSKELTQLVKQYIDEYRKIIG